MPIWTKQLTGGASSFQDIDLKLTMNIASQNQATNTSTINFLLQLVENYDAGYYSSTASNNAFSMTVTSLGTESDTFVYDFRPSGLQTKTLISGSFDVVHDADGNKTLNLTAAITRTANIGTGSIASTQWVLTRIPKVPDTPAAPVISGVGQDSATQNLTLPNNNGSALTRSDFELYDALTGGSVVGSHTASGLPTTKLWDDLTPETQYFAAARVENGVGWSDWSARTEFNTLVATAPAKMAAPTLSSLTPTSVTVNWVTPAYYGATATGFDIQYASDAEFTNPTTTTAIAGATSKALTIDTTVAKWARVRAKSTGGTGQWSDAVFIGYDADVPDQPPTPILVSKGATSFIVQVVETTINVAPVTGYWVVVQGPGGIEYDVESMDLEREVTGLTAGAEYGVQVFANSAEGYSVGSPLLEFTLSSGPWVANNAQDGFLRSELLVANNARDAWLEGAEMYVANDARDGWLAVE